MILHMTDDIHYYSCTCRIKNNDVDNIIISSQHHYKCHIRMTVITISTTDTCKSLRNGSQWQSACQRHCRMAVSPRSTTTRPLRTGLRAAVAASVICHPPSAIRQRMPPARTARAGNRRKGPLSALRAHAETSYKNRLTVENAKVA
jgi:hypothetical protein